MAVTARSDETVETDARRRQDAVVPPLAPTTTVEHRLAELAATVPDVVAVLGDDGTSLTYGELLERCDALAASLVARGLPDGDEPLAVLCRRDVGALVALLGALRAGRPFAVLDRETPPARTRQVHELSGAPLVLTDDPVWAAAVLDVPASRLHQVGPHRSPAGSPLPPATSAPDGTAAVIFTSGSTGAPKGVLWEHQTFVVDACSARDRLGIGPDDRVPVLMPLAFAAGLTVALFGLLNGATVALEDPRSGGGPAEVVRWLRSNELTTLHGTPSLLRALLAAMEPDDRIDRIRLVTSAGEPIQGADVERSRRRFPNATFVNWLGSSEVGALSFHPIAPGDPIPVGTIPAGRPVDAKEVTVVDADGAPVGPGVTGAVVVTSDAISRGYWRAPELTASRFARSADGRRSFRTGDLGRLDEDGVLEPMGREDAAVKVRGYLVEPSEVEAVLAAAPGVADVVVLAERPEGAAARLVAHVVPTPSAPPSASALRRAVAEVLPSYMTPARVVFLDELPRNERGKVDRAALAAAGAGPSAAPVAPRDEWEAAVADIWARALGLESVGVEDDFSELGGDSLAAEEVVAAAGDHFGVPARSAWLVEARTVADFARRVRSSRARGGRSSAVVLRAGATGTPLFCVPGAGGIGFAFLSLAQRLAPGRPVLALEAHGLEGRDLPSYTVPMAARRQIAAVRRVQPRGPYLLAGHSLGGLVAFEMARRLEAQGEEVALLAVLDTFPPGAAHRTAPTTAEPDGPAPSLRTRVLERFWGRGGGLSRSTPGNVVRIATAGVVQHDGLRQYEAFFRRGIVMTQLYRPRPYGGRTLLVTASEVEPDALDPAAAWEPLLDGPGRVVRVSGDHHSMLAEPHVAQVASALDEELDRLGL